MSRAGAAAVVESPAAGAQPAKPVRASVAEPLVRRLGVVPYRPVFEAMRSLTAARNEESADELWVLQHLPVYTVGLAGRAQHFPRESSIPLEHVDRGGQITYHGPGQAVVYALIDLARRQLSVRAMVRLLEQAAIDVLGERGVAAARRAGAPGVYVEDAKIAALGLRVRAGRCYHGIAINVDMDLAPFLAIDPCGYPGLRVTQACDLGIGESAAEIGDALASAIALGLENPDGR